MTHGFPNFLCYLTLTQTGVWDHQTWNQWLCL